MHDACSATEADKSYSCTQAAWTDHKCPIMLVACVVAPIKLVSAGRTKNTLCFAGSHIRQLMRRNYGQPFGLPQPPQCNAAGPIQSRRTAIRGAVAGRHCWVIARSQQPPLQGPPAGRPPWRRLPPMPAAPSRRQRRRRPTQLTSADRDRTGATPMHHDRNMSRCHSIRKVTTNHCLE